MIDCSLMDVCAELDASPLGEDGPVHGVSIDSRSLQSGALFFALQGRFDGHDYVDQAREAGACAAVVTRVQPIDLPQIVVEDTEQALAQLARWWRGQLRQTRFIAVTGSNGKTTTKTILRDLLTSVGKTQATQGNLNNHLGVPLTLLSFSRDTRFGICELGASGVGEIERLCRMVEPHYVIGLNAGRAHLEGFGSIEALRRAKGEIFSAAPNAAKCIYWLDQPELSDWLLQIGARSKQSFSLEQRSADVYVDAERVYFEQRSAPYSLPLLGEHNRLNAAAAVATVVPDLMTLDEAAAALGDVSVVAGRLQILCDGPVTVINDAYNANPQSMVGAIDVLNASPGHRVLVMSDMAELGRSALDQHIEVIDHALAQVDQVFYTGKWREALAAQFTDRIDFVDDNEGLTQRLDQMARPATVLYKASRGAGLDLWAKSYAEQCRAQESVH